MARPKNLLEAIQELHQTQQQAAKVDAEYRDYMTNVAPKKIQQIQDSLRHRLTAQEDEAIDSAINCLERMEADFAKREQETAATYEQLAKISPKARSTFNPKEEARKNYEHSKRAQMAIIATMLPKGCPTTLEGLRAYKAKREQDAKEQQQKERQQKEQQQQNERLNLERQRVENEQKRRIQERRNQKNNLIAEKSYGRWHLFIGMTLAVLTSLFVMPSLGYLSLLLIGIVGGVVGHVYRNSVIKAGTSYQLKEDVEQISGNEQLSKLQALQYGLESHSWKNYLQTYYNAHKRSVTFAYGKEFSAGLIQGIANNEEVIHAVRKRLT